MLPLIRTSKCLRDKSSDDGETDEHPSSPNPLMKSPPRTLARTPSKKRKETTEPIKKRSV